LAVVFSSSSEDEASVRNAKTAAKRRVKKFGYNRSLSRARKKKRSEVNISDLSKKSPTEFEQSSNHSKLNKTDRKQRNQRPEKSRESSGSSLHRKKFKEDNNEWQNNLSMMIAQLGYEIKNESSNNCVASSRRLSMIQIENHRLGSEDRILGSRALGSSNNFNLDIEISN
jgi:hypothetical protein